MNTNSTEQWFVVAVNPYPWKVPPMSVGRKGKALFVTAGRDEGLYTYQQAIKEQLEFMAPTIILGPVKLRLWFYRNIPEYTTPQGRRARKHEADTTNLQKATEDALQGLLYANDKDVKDIHSVLVDQSPVAASLLVICAEPYDNGVEFPAHVQSMIDDTLGAFEPAHTFVDLFDATEEEPF